MKRLYKLFILCFLLLFINCGIKYYSPPPIDNLEFPIPEKTWEVTINGEIICDEDYHYYMKTNKDLLIFISKEMINKKATFNICCTKLSTGQISWVSPLPTEEFRDIAVDLKNSVLLFRSKTDKLEKNYNSVITALRIPDGETLWSKKFNLYDQIEYDFLNDSTSVNLISFETKYVSDFLAGTSDYKRIGFICRINHYFGDTLWESKLSTHTNKNSLANKDSLIILGEYDSKVLYALDKYNGKKRWQIDNQNIKTFSIIDNLLFTTIETNNRNELVGLDIVSGIKKLSIDNVPDFYETGEISDFAVLPFSDRENEYLVTDFRRLYYTNFSDSIMNYLNKPAEESIDSKIAKKAVAGLLLGPAGLLLSSGNKLPSFKIEFIYIKNDTITLAGYKDEELQILVYRSVENNTALSEIKSYMTGLKKNDKGFLNSVFERWGPRDKMLLLIKNDGFYQYDVHRMEIEKFTFDSMNFYGFFDDIKWFYLYPQLAYSDLAHTLRGYDVLTKRIRFEIPVSTKCGTFLESRYSFYWDLGYHKAKFLTVDYPSDYCLIQVFRETYDYRIDLKSLISYDVLDKDNLICYHSENKDDQFKSILVCYNLK